jgi:hypothetical protein
VCGISRGEIKESIRLRERFGMILRGSWPKGRGSTPIVVSEIRTSSFLSVVERIGEHFTAMPLRRRDRPIPMLDPALEREMHELRAMLDAMETTQRFTVGARDINEAESENEDGNEG